MPLDTKFIPQSFFDRCLDDEPKKLLENVLNETDSLKLFKKGVRRDLELLLNTRKSEINGIENFAFANKSVLNFGIKDFTEINSQTVEGQEQIRLLIKSAIELFEPRLTDVEIAVTDSTEDGKLAIKIYGLLLVEPIATPISYDATLDTKTQLYQIGT